MKTSYTDSEFLTGLRAHRLAGKSVLKLRGEAIAPDAKITLRAGELAALMTCPACSGAHPDGSARQVAAVAGVSNSTASLAVRNRTPDAEPAPLVRPGTLKTVIRDDAGRITSLLEEPVNIVDRP